MKDIILLSQMEELAAIYIERDIILDKATSLYLFLLFHTVD